MFRKIIEKINFAIVLSAFLYGAYALCDLVGQIGKWILSTATEEK